MATPYVDIYQRALFRISDAKLARMPEDEQTYILRNYLMSAISDFQNKCQEDLQDRDDETCEFVADLGDEVKEILALGVSYYWLSARVMNEQLLRNRLSTKDYTYFSPANLLREATELRNQLRKEYRDRMVNYTYDHGNIAMEE